MSDLLSHEELHRYLEQISEQGCETVSKLLYQVDQGGSIPEIEHLEPSQQQQVIKELRKVMAVYTECSVDS